MNCGTCCCNDRRRQRARGKPAFAPALTALLLCVAFVPPSPPAPHAPPLPPAPHAALARPARPPPPPPDEAAAVALFAELTGRSLAQPLYAVADLTITRGGVTRSLLLRLHLRAPGHVLVQVKTPPPGSTSHEVAARANERRVVEPREDGNVLLQFRDRLHLWFPRANLALEVPALLGGARLFGSDFSLDHLVALGDDGRRWHAVDVTGDTLGDETCQRLTLRPRESGANPATDTSYAAIELWLARGPRGELLPRQLDGFDEHGVLVSRVRLQSSGRIGLPDTWTAWTLPPRAGADVSTLRITFLERDPPIAPELFLPEALKQWR